MLTDLEQMSANTIRALAIDAVQTAKSGHPRMPAGVADAAVALAIQFGVTVDQVMDPARKLPC